MNNVILSLSYDGGLTWKVVKLGAHMFGIGHYGSILVIVDDEQPTYHILYREDGIVIPFGTAGIMVDVVQFQ